MTDDYLMMADATVATPAERLGAMADHLREVLWLLGQNPNREGLLETPRRIAQAWVEMTSGTTEDPTKHLQKQFTAPHDNMIVVSDIPFVSLCEHHFAPFTGKCHIGYVPGLSYGQDSYRIVGLSKFARVVEGYAKRPQIQEVLTDQIADAIEDTLEPQGCIVVMRATHTCMSLRGAKANGSTTHTSSIRGIFTNTTNGLRDEFFHVLSMQPKAQ